MGVVALRNVYNHKIYFHEHIFWLDSRNLQPAKSLHPTVHFGAVSPNTIISKLSCPRVSGIETFHCRVKYWDRGPCVDCDSSPSSPTPHPPPLTSHSSPPTPHPPLLTPHSSPPTPHPSLPTLPPLTPLPSPLTPHSSHPTPHPSHSSPSTPHSSPSTPHPPPITPHPASPLTPTQMVEYLVGDGPNNRYALICSSCLSHNGMALQDEFEFLSFRCAYCYHLNPARRDRPPLLPRPQPLHATPTEEGVGLQHSPATNQIARSERRGRGRGDERAQAEPEVATYGSMNWGH